MHNQPKNDYGIKNEIINVQKMEYDFRLLGSGTVQAGRQVLLLAKEMPSSTGKTRGCRKRIFLP
jgi:hypothetical protein